MELSSFRLQPSKVSLCWFHSLYLALITAQNSTASRSYSLYRLQLVLGCACTKKKVQVVSHVSRHIGSDDRHRHQHASKLETSTQADKA